MNCVRIEQSAALLAGIAMLAAAGRTTEGQDGGSPKPAQIVKMTDKLKFTPAKVTIKVGDTLQWRNAPSTIVHTVTCVPELAKKPEHVQLPKGAMTFNSGEIEPGQTFTHTFLTPGSYKYFCIPHELNRLTAGTRVKPRREPQRKAAKNRAG